MQFSGIANHHKIIKISLQMRQNNTYVSVTVLWKYKIFKMRD